MTEASPPISQAMIDAYDAYTHVTLDRRGLIAGLSRLTGSTAAALAVLPLLEANAAHAATVAEDDARLTTEMLEWPGAEGDRMRGYMAWAKAGAKSRPLVLVIHENRGLTPHIRNVTRRMALEGFAALAPDFLAPSGGTPADENAAREAIGRLDRERTVANGVATLRRFRVRKGKYPTTGRTGAIGFCWGGGMVNALAVAAGDLLQAAVPFYGPVPADLSKVPQIEAKLLLHYAGNDERINAGLPAYEAALKSAEIDHVLHVYEGKQHAFHNDTSAARYDEAAAELAWKRTTDFLRATLR
jgi:carboxymethylenebutenolidase